MNKDECKKTTNLSHPMIPKLFLYSDTLIVKSLAETLQLNSMKDNKDIKVYHPWRMKVPSPPNSVW